MSVSNRWVVDASVALKWYLRDTEFITQADRLLEAFSLGAATLAAPSFMRYEIANAFVVARRRGRLSLDQLNQRLESSAALQIEEPENENATLLAAVELTTQFPVAFYDALYLAAAQQLEYRFVTADNQLHEAIKDQLPWEVWIGNLEAGP